MYCHCCGTEAPVQWLLQDSSRATQEASGKRSQPKAHVLCMLLAFAGELSITAEPPTPSATPNALCKLMISSRRHTARIQHTIGEGCGDGCHVRCRELEANKERARVANTVGETKRY